MCVCVCVCVCVFRPLLQRGGLGESDTDEEGGWGGRSDMGDGGSEEGEYPVSGLEFRVQGLGFSSPWSCMFSQITPTR